MTPVCRCPVMLLKRHAVAQVQHDEDRQEHAVHRARAAEYAHPPEQHDGDDVELEAEPHVAPDRAEAGREEDSRERGEEPGRGEEKHLDPRDVDAGVAGHLQVDADDVDLPAEPAVAEHDHREHQQREEEDERERERADEGLLPERLEPRRKLLDGAVLPTVLVVVDRTELEGQLRDWVERLLGDVQNQDIPVWRANSRTDLQTLLKTDRRGLILSMIHKFEGIEADANIRDTIYVFIDEAHRSVAKDLGTYLMAAVPNATIIGFTGTPIARTQYGEGTFKIFGGDDDLGYLDKYTIAESIEDETTLPICHTLAPSDMTVPAERLDKEFFALAEMEGVTDVDELNRVLDRAVGLRTFLTADDRIDKVAAFVANHFRRNVAPLGYKAFLVGVNREACAKYKRALDRHLPRRLDHVPIYTENAADIIDRPLVAEHQVSPEREADVRRTFKKAGAAPHLLIVTDKLLTGYDAPLLYCLYLDKPMRDHVLLQAIARVNRPYVDASGARKRVGLVVDFVGVLRELRKALRFDSSDVSGAIEDLDVLMQDFHHKIAAAEADYLQDTGGSPDERLERIVYGRFLAPEARQAFFEAYKEIEALWEILSPSPGLRGRMETFKRLAQLYAAVRNAYADDVSYAADLARKTHGLVAESATQEGLGYRTKVVTFDLRTLQALRSEPGPDEAKVFNLVRGLRQEIANEPDRQPVLLPLKERAERILRDLADRTASGLEAMARLAVLAEEKETAMAAAQDSGLSPRAFAVHWVLKDDTGLRAAGIDTLDLAQRAEALLDRFPNAAVNADEQRRLRAALYAPLLALDSGARSRVVERIVAVLLGTDADADA